MIRACRSHAAWFSALLVVYTAAAAACGSAARTSSADSTRIAGDLAAHFANLESRTFHVSYEVVTLKPPDPEDPTIQPHQLEWFKDGVTAQRFDIVGTNHSGKPVSFSIFARSDKEGLISCVSRPLREGPSGCTDDHGASATAELILLSMGFSFVLGHTDSVALGPDAAIVSREERHVAGVNAECYKEESATSREYEEYCFSGDNTLLRVIWAMDAQTIRRVTAVSVGKPLTDKDFVLPYPLLPSPTATPPR